MYTNNANRTVPFAIKITAGRTRQWSGGVGVCAFNARAKEKRKQLILAKFIVHLPSKCSAERTQQKCGINESRCLEIVKVDWQV